MSQLLICPSCNAEMTLDVLISHQEVRETFAWFARTALPLGGKVERYLRLFKPEKQRLRMEKYAELLAALQADIQRGAITRKGREWPCSLESWALALEAVFEAHSKGSLTPPLKDHAYLYEIIVRMVDDYERKAESARERERRVGLERFENRPVIVKQPQAESIGSLLEKAPVTLSPELLAKRDALLPAHKRRSKNGDEA
jgi:DNA-directed RNA polymerase specialized sigma24 family protein